MNGEVTQERLAIRAKPKPVRRFSRSALMATGAVAILFVAAVASYAFRDVAPDGAASASELYNTTNKPLPDTFTSLPTNYSEVETVQERPALGPPLPGDLGAAMLAQSEPVETRDNPFRYVPPASSAPGPATHAPATQVSEVRSSDLFFIKPPDRTRSTRGADIGAVSPSNPVDQLAALFPASTGNQPLISGQPADPGRQERKESFLTAEVDEQIYNPHHLQTPVSPYQVMAGTVIPASLITGLNSDLPGQVIAQVTENVYDTATGQYLLIPQGTRLIGRYDSVIAFGQSRALMVWSRIIMPDGTSMTIENLPGVDQAGYAGVADRVDNHSWKLFQAAILSSVLSVGAELGRDSNDDEILEALRNGGQRTLNQAGQRIVERQLNVQPTITVRPGWRLNVIVNKDIILQPYGA